ncbi:MAG TPA: hypothetical protein VHX87_01880 [Galbitalea sp.]|jgi:hypothetical protein|nr:hypothetical protein [Galbitalea sp.]
MNRILTTSLIGSAAAIALVAGSCAPAFADGATPAPHGQTLADIQKSASIKTTQRIGSLNTAIARVNAAKDITTADRATILATLNADVAGMNTVEAKIAADTDVATAAADYRTIFLTYRVYAVAIPQARFAAAADRMTGTAIPRLTDAQTRLAAALSGPDAGKSTPALQADLTDMQNQIAAATSGLNGVAAASLAVTPADFNANHSVLEPERTSVKSALADIRKAVSDGKTILAAIK